MGNTRRITMALLAVVTMLGLSATSAAAATEPDRAGTLALLGRQASTTAELKQQIALQLRIAPGGKQTAVNEVSYDNGKFVVTYALPGARAMASPDCPSGWFCFYDGTSWNYPHGRLSDCWWQDLGAYGWHDRTSSVDNSTGSDVDYDNHYDAGNPANGHNLDGYLFTSWAHSASSTVSASNRADHVYRYC